MIAVNDNLTIAEFKAYAAPKPSVAMVDESSPEVSRNYLVRGSEGWGLMRVGLYQFDRRHPRAFLTFPVAAAPHPFCPAHSYVAPAAGRPPLRSKSRPSHLQVVA